jgi:hypothetical protein
MCSKIYKKLIMWGKRGGWGEEGALPSLIWEMDRALNLFSKTQILDECHPTNLSVPEDAKPQHHQ